MFDDVAGSPDRFGYEWAAYPEIRPEYEEQFRRWTVLVPAERWRDASFLDVGCGTGRNSYWPMLYGARTGVAVDLDERSLSAARRNLARFSQIEVRRASAYALPFADRFDIVFSIGVIHHLEKPQEAVREMARAARPGGEVLIWVYGREANEWLVRILDPARRALLSRLPVAFVHHLSLYPAGLLWVVLRLGLQPNAYLRLAARFGFAHLRSIVFDQMLPRIAHYWRRSEVEALMRNAGLEDVRLAPVNGISWCAIGRRPDAPA
ncbi:MAG: class I SAM-dependent methyltransferase [Alphaproteobacteria bacterium]|nr:class I SAM-dependent methyltransferase [Alphaproteobacteria bacterium]